jgi:Mlc titration factor MtfA (ptsG expression regulator)
MSSFENIFLGAIIAFVFLTPAGFLVYGIYMLLKNRKVILLPPVYRPNEKALVQLHMEELPWYKKMDPEKRDLLENRVIFFLREKNFIPRQGFALQTRHKVILAAAACRITNGLRVNSYDALKYILVYPDSFVNKSTNTLRVCDSDLNGVIAVSWKHVEAGLQGGPAVPDVALRAFAMGLRDNETGIGTNEAWFSNYLVKYERIISKLYQQLKTAPHPFFEKLLISKPDHLYTASIERFFSSPVELHTHFPELYHQLALLLNQNPAATGTYGAVPRKLFGPFPKEPGKVLVHFGDIDLNQPLFRFVKALFSASTFAFAENGILIRHGMYSEKHEYVPYEQVTCIWYEENIIANDSENPNSFCERNYISGDDLSCEITIAYVNAVESKQVSWQTINLPKKWIDKMMEIVSGYNITVHLRTVHPAWGLHSVKLK